MSSSKKVRNSMPTEDLGRNKKGQDRRNKGEEEKGIQRLNTMIIKLEEDLKKKMGERI